MATPERLQPDFLEQWPCKVLGFSRSKEFSYRVYVAVLLTFYTYFLAMTIIGFYIALPDVNNCIAAIFMFMSVNWLLSAMTFRLATARYLDELFDMMEMGIYHYENEELDETNEELAQKVEKDYVRRDNAMFYVYVVAYSTSMIGSPLIGYLFDKEELDKHRNPIVNPLLPHFYYSPFDTNHLVGFFVTYSIDLVFWLMGVSATVYTIKIIMISISQLVLQLKILNRSLENIHKRALSLYRKQAKSPTQLDEDKIRKFNECLHSCLKSNIQHHQILLRFKHVFQPYIGCVLLAIFSALIIVIYAALLYLLLLKRPMSVRMKYIAMFVSEQFCTYLICLFGEDVITESTVMFEKLYAMSWFKYDRQFKQTLHIMMMHVRVPLRHKAYFLDASASMESYAELVKATYSLTNLIVPSQNME